MWSQGGKDLFPQVHQKNSRVAVRVGLQGEVSPIPCRKPRLGECCPSASQSRPVFVGYVHTLLTEAAPAEVATFRLDEGELGLRLRLDHLAQTDDIDIASFERLSLALEDVTAPPLTEVLAEFDFAPVPDLDRGRVWRWRQTRGNQLVEFLTPSFSEEEGRRPLAALGVDAQALHHLNYLIADPIPAAVTYRSGVLVQIPRPERFAIHKLIVADRRRDGPDTLKARKDLMQAEILIEALAEDRPDELVEAWHDARNRGPKWRERVDRSLARSVISRERLTAL